MAIPKDDLIEALASDPNNVEQLQLLYGWVGESNRKGYVRLYNTLELVGYSDISEEDVVFTRSLKNSENPIGGTLIWVTRDAKVITTGQQQAPASEPSFLSGELAPEVEAAEDHIIVIQDDVMLRCGKRTRRPKHCPPPRTIYNQPSARWATCLVNC